MDTKDRAGQIQRINHYEQILNEAESILRREDISEELMSVLSGKIEELSDYYGSDEWKADFADDEAGLLPDDLPRGILSEDGIYNILENYRKIETEISFSNKTRNLKGDSNMEMGKKRNKALVWIIVVAVFVVVAVAVLFLTGVFGNFGTGESEMIVGDRIKLEDITDFYYTYDSSTNPPEYQRYRYYTDEGDFFFYHEKREGNHWPLTEDDISESGTVSLTEEQWNAFYDLLKGGTVRKRTESADSGDAGPWLYLYWTNDSGVNQVFSFESYGKQTDFEAMCEGLME